jgi:hypothetical protein
MTNQEMACRDTSFRRKPESSAGELQSTVCTEQLQNTKQIALSSYQWSTLIDDIPLSIKIDKPYLSKIVSFLYLGSTTVVAMQMTELLGNIVECKDVAI